MLTKYYLIIIEIILVNDMQIFAFPLNPYYLRKWWEGRVRWLFDTRNTAPLMLDPSAQCSGCPGDGAWFPLFLDQTEAGRAENFFFKTGPFFSQGLDDPHLPPRLSEGLDLPLQCRSKKVSQTHQDLEKDFCSFFLALSRWRESRELKQRRRQRQQERQKKQSV